MEPTKNFLLLVLLFVNLVGLYGLGNKAGKVVFVNFNDTIVQFNITSPNYPGKADPGTNISWVVNAPNGNRLRLVCTDIYLPKNANCSRGALSITDSLKKSEHVNLCSQTSSYIRESNGTWMTVQFTTGAFSRGRVNCVVGLIKNSVIRQVHKQTSCPCGMTNTTKPLSDEEKKYPFTAVIKNRLNNLTICGGSILTQQHILTAAWCLMNVQMHELKVVVGDYDETKDSYTQTLSITKMHRHRKFSFQHRTNDIGLIVVSKEILFNEMVGPVCLPTEQYHLQTVIIGWKRKRSSSIRDIKVQVIGSDRCLEPVNLKKTSKSTHFCTDRINPDPFTDMVGAPLVYVDPELKSYVQVALIPWSDSQKTIAHTDVFAFYDWIQKKISGKT